MTSYSAPPARNTEPAHGNHWGTRLKSLATLAALLCAGTASAQVAPMAISMITTEGVVNGKPVLIETIVAAPAGTDSQKLSAMAVAEARKSGAEVNDGFSTLFGVFPQFFDKTGKNNTVTVSYNPSGASVGGTQAALQAALDSWSSVKGSTFRYTFGGLTTRQPAFGDGFNDVYWRSGTGTTCGDGCVLAQALIRTDDRTAAILEFDIVMYAYPGVWTTSPPDAANPAIDVQTVFLHELGHAAGIGHSTDQPAVMYPYVADNVLKQQLTPDETTALVFLYGPKTPTLAGTSTPSDKHNFNLLAALDSPAPGGGTYVDHFESGPSGVNKNGDVVFAADVDVPGREVLFQADKSGVTRLLSPGQVVSGVVLGDHTISYASINDVGGAAVVWATYPGDYRFPYGVDSVVLRKTANAPFNAVVVPRVTSAPGGGWFYGAADAALSQAGDVAFLGLVDSGFGVRPGVFVAAANGAITAVARPGDPAPGGGVFRAGTWISIASQGGYVAFTARTTVSGSGGALFFSDPRAGQLVRIAGHGDPAIGGGTIVGVNAPKVNAKGDVLFSALTSRTGDRFSYRELYLYSGGVLKAVARKGDQLADGRIFVSAMLNSWSMNDAGDVTFGAMTQSRQFALGIPQLGSLWAGYYATWKGLPEFIARDFDNLLGAGTLLFMGDAGISTLPIGAHGDIVFPAYSNGSGVTYLIRASRKVYTQ